MKKSLINVSMISVATAVVLSMTGCGGGGSGGTTAGGATSTTTTGTAADGYIKNATVCLDMNENGKCDSDEPFAITGTDGNYTLTVTAKEKAKADKNAPLLVSGGMDIDTDANLTGTFKAPYTGGTTTNITPITTLVSAMVAKGTSVDTAYKQVAKALNLTETEVTSDPVKLAKDDNNTKVIQAAMTIYHVITTMAKSAGVNNSKIYSDLVTAIKTVADDSNTTTKSIATIVTTAADEANSTLPSEAKRAAKMAGTIGIIVSKAIKSNPKSVRAAALISSDVVDNVIQKELEANKKTIAEIENDALNALTTAKPKNIAVKNLLSSYGLTASPSEISSIANNIGSLDNVKVIKIINSSDINATTKSDLQKAYTKQQTKLYVEKHGQTVTNSEVAEIAAKTGISYSTLSTMSLADFSKKIYVTGDADLMSLSLKLSPPANIASMSDIQKAKDLFTSVRTQVNDAKTFTQNESTKIDAALQNVTDSVTFTATALNTFDDMISYAIDTNQTKVSRLVDGGDRNITVSKTTASGNVAWNYTIKDKNVTTPWSGSLTYTDVNPDTFNPANFTTLSAKLTGTMPIDFYGAKIPKGDANSQSVDANVKIDKTTNGAKLNLNAAITNNGDSVSIKDANLVVAYDVNSTTKEPLPKYVELQNLYVNGTVGDYTLDGKLDVKSYAVNKIGAAKGFDPKTNYYWFGMLVECDKNSTLQVSNVKYDGISATDFYDGTNNNGTYYGLNWNNMTSAPVDVSNAANYTGLLCSDGSSPTIFYPYKGHWTDDSFQNSGYLPSETTFNGTLTNNVTSAYLNANIDAKWTNIVDANLSNDTYKPNLNVVVAGALQMPSSAPMKVNLNYSNVGVKQNIAVTYVNGDTSITAKTYIPSKDSNITVNLSSSAGIQAKIVADSHGHVDYSASTLTNKSGKTVGSFVDRAGVTVVKYPDGTFESLY